MKTPIYFFWEKISTENLKILVSEYYNNLCSKLFARLILQPTRVTEKSKLWLVIHFFNSFYLLLLKKAKFLLRSRFLLSEISKTSAMKSLNMN